MLSINPALAGWRNILFNNKISFNSRKYITLALFLTIYMTIYSLTSRISPFPIQEISYSWLDLAIPYLPGFAIIYISFYALMLLPLLVCKNEIMFKKLLKAYIGITMISMAIFFFLPTQFYWNLSQYNDPLTELIMIPIRNADDGLNALPSNHAAFSMIGGMFYFWHKKYKRSLIFGIWGSLIAASTVLVKQHFVVDVLTGIALALIALIMTEKFSKFSKKYWKHLICLN